MSRRMLRTCNGSGNNRISIGPSGTWYAQDRPMQLGFTWSGVGDKASAFHFISTALEVDIH